MNSRFTVTKWSSVLMIVAMLCNIMGGMKLFCAKEKSGPRQAIDPPLVVGALNDDQIMTTGTSPHSLQVAQYEGQPVRCKCKKTKSCSAISRVIRTSNLIQRFNENQRHAWSESSHFIDVLDLQVSKTLCGSSPSYSNLLDTCVHDVTPSKLVLSCVLLI